MRRTISRLLSGLKYLISVFFMYAGIETALAPTAPSGGPVGYIYSTRFVLVLLGVWFFMSGFLLMYAKIRQNKELVGHSLLSMYLAFLFGTVLNGYSGGWTVDTWLPNLVASFVIAALYLRWKYHILYVPRLSHEEALKRVLKG